MEGLYFPALVYVAVAAIQATLGSLAVLAMRDDEPARSRDDRRPTVVRTETTPAWRHFGEAFVRYFTICFTGIMAVLIVFAGQLQT